MRTRSVSVSSSSSQSSRVSWQPSHEVNFHTARVVIAASPPVGVRRRRSRPPGRAGRSAAARRSEEHTSELQSRQYLVCRLLLEKKKKHTNTTLTHSRSTAVLQTTSPAKTHWTKRSLKAADHKITHLTYDHSYTRNII